MDIKIPELQFKEPAPTILKAGQMVGIDLEKQIDCSLMDVKYAMALPIMEEHSRSMVVIRRSVLTTFIINDLGERERLTITFELRSNRFPKS